MVIGGMLGILDSLTGGEVLIILVVALLILGPERLPETARTLGQWVAKLRSMTGNLQSEVRQVLDDPAMQPIREVGEFVAAPRKKLVEFALAAEAEAEAAKQIADDAEAAALEAEAAAAKARALADQAAAQASEATEAAEDAAEDLTDGERAVVEELAPSVVDAVDVVEVDEPEAEHAAPEAAEPDPAPEPAPEERP